MVKISCIPAVLAVLLLFSSCAAGAEDRENIEIKQQNYNTGEDGILEKDDDRQYRDGVYEGKGDAWEYGNEAATVVIRDGRITAVALKKYSKDGIEVDYNEWAGQTVNGNTIPNLKQYRLDLAESMLQAQTYRVPSIRGAAISCENWKLAVKRALNKAKM
jgi:uncharacterized protein with FMN-binding domain